MKRIEPLATESGRGFRSVEDERKRFRERSIAMTAWVILGLTGPWSTYGLRDFEIEALSVDGAAFEVRLE